MSDKSEKIIEILFILFLTITISLVVISIWIENSEIRCKLLLTTLISAIITCVLGHILNMFLEEKLRYWSYKDDNK